MNKTRTQSMYTSDQPNMRMDIFNTVESAKRSGSNAYYKQVHERFFRQSARYLRSSIN